MNRTNDTASPVNPLPAVVVALFLTLLGIELVFTLGARGLVGGPDAVGWRLAAIQRYAFSSEILDWMWTTGRWPAEHLIRFVSYLFVHGSFTHALIAGVFLLAMGKMVAEVFGSLAMLLVFFLSGIGGALAYGLLVQDGIPLIGAFPALSLNWVIRCIQPMRATQLKIQASCACSGTWLWLISMDFFGSRNTLLPSTGERKLTPFSSILRNFPRLQTWKPPESVSIGLSQPIKPCNPPCFLTTSVPGLSIR